MAETARTLHLMEGSMAFTNSDHGFKEGIEAQLKHEPDLVYLTEMNNFHDALREVLKGTEYRPVFLVQNRGGAFYVKHSDHLSVKDRGAKKVHPGNPVKPSEGGYPARYIDWVQVNWYGNHVFYHGAHWITGYSEGGLRDARHEATSKLMADLVKRHGKGKNISFFSGDQNVDEAMDNKRTDRRSQVDRIFRDNGLLTIWDEMEVTPGTHGNRTIDIIGSYDPDKRVKAIRWKVHPLTNSDHRPISAWYEVKHAVKGGVGGNTGGGSTNPTPVKGFVTGGNVDFSDYADGSVYPLPYAIDDSDLTNG